MKVGLKDVQGVGGFPVVNPSGWGSKRINNITHLCRPNALHFEEREKDVMVNRTKISEYGPLLNAHILGGYYRGGFDCRSDHPPLPWNFVLISPGDLVVPLPSHSWVKPHLNYTYGRNSPLPFKCSSEPPLSYS